MPNTRPGGQHLLPHALETGVRIHCQRRRAKSTLVGIRLSKGYGYVSHQTTQTTLYRIKNSKKETFKLVLDHHYHLREPQVACALARPGGDFSPHAVDRLLDDGVRATVALGPEQALVFGVAESSLQWSNVQLADATDATKPVDAGWLQSNIVASNSPLADQPAIRTCLALRRRLDDKTAEIQAAEKAIKRLALRQERLRKNISTGGHDDQTNRWKTDLGTAENTIVELEDQALPKLHQQDKAIRQELGKAVMELAAEWNADGTVESRLQAAIASDFSDDLGGGD